MPFSGPSDPDLPSNVQRLSVGKRRQWVSVWNSTFRSCMAGKLPPAPKDVDEEEKQQSRTQRCEGRAFRIANGVVKELGMEVEEDITSETPTDEEKHYDEQPVFVHPLGGATSFADAESFLQAQADLSTFKVLLDNIMSRHDDDGDEDIGEAVEKLGREFSQRQRRSSGSRGVIDRVKDFFSGNVFLPSEEEKESPEGGFLVFKDISGAWRWLAIVTNQFYDRDKEVFPEEAHKEYEAYLDETKNYPELWVWHTPGSRMGVADFFTYADGFVLSSGTFDKGFEEAAETLKNMREGLGVSHGFTFPEELFDSDGAYNKYRMHEISPLPHMKASNPWTEFSTENIKEVREAMSLKPEKRDFLVGILGEDRTARIEQYLPDLAKELKAEGVTFKQLGEGLDEDAPAAGNGNGDSPDSEEEAKPPAAAEEEEKLDEEETEEDSSDEGASDDPEVEKALGVLTEKMETFSKMLDDKFSSLEERLDALEKTDDEKIAAAMRPRGSGNGKNRPTEDDDNTIDPEKAKSITGDQTDEDKEGRPVNRAREYVEDMMHPGTKS